jgi:hypothetical protein
MSKDFRNMNEKEFLTALKTLFGDAWDEGNWNKIAKEFQKDFISWVGEVKQQTWDYRKSEKEKKTKQNYQWQRAWEMYHKEYIASVIEVRLDTLG